MFQLSYINYLVMLFVVAGVFVLIFDTKKYKREQQKKEEKVSRVLGWTNIVLGVVGYIGNWVIQLFLY
jgi:hypothetical protein